MNDLVTMLCIILLAWASAISWYAYQLHCLINEMHMEFVKRECWEQPGTDQ